MTAESERKETDERRAFEAWFMSQWPDVELQESWATDMWTGWQAARAAAPASEVRKFAAAILHGDARHRAWLTDAAEAFIAGQPLPAPSPVAAPPAGWRPEIIAFANAMEAKLRANDHKGGWKDDSPGALFDRLMQEAHELQRAFGKWDKVERDILGEAADVANFAMFIADVKGVLAAAPVPPSAWTFFGWAVGAKKLHGGKEWRLSLTEPGCNPENHALGVEIVPLFAAASLPSAPQETEK